MFQYCVQHCLMSEDVAFRRIRVARSARRHPGILLGITNGSLSLTTVVLLAPYLTSENASVLLKAAEHQRKSAVELLIAKQFPKRDMPTIVEPIICQKLAPEPVATLCVSAISDTSASQDQFASPAVAPVQVPASSIAPTRMAPLAPERFGLQTTIDEGTHADLVRAQELLGHVSSCMIPEVLRKALRLYVIHLEKLKLAATEHPREARSLNRDPRHIPSAVKREVRQRDRDRCTFVSESGHQCEERAGLEFDHIVPVARGGMATIENIRLRCPGHNQLEAERVFGAAFMEHKREAARDEKEKRGGVARAG